MKRDYRVYLEVKPLVKEALEKMDKEMRNEAQKLCQIEGRTYGQ